MATGTRGGRGSSSRITPSYKQKWTSKLRLAAGKVFPGSKMAKSRESPDEAGPSSDQHMIENGARLFEALIVSSRGNSNPIRMFSAKELLEATDGYDEGAAVYLSDNSGLYIGTHDGRPVAVKRGFAHLLGVSAHGPFDMFLNEAVSLAQINHRNVVRLLGCCIETRDPILVYELVARGSSLYRHIHVADASRGILPWADRLRIAIEVADALNYLHTALHPPIFHGDVKSSNIILDGRRSSAKLGNFAFSEQVSRRPSRKGSSGSGGGPGANPDHPGCHLRQGVTEKNDVFGFGLVLIELVTGKEPSEGDDGGSRNTISLARFTSSTREDSLGSVLDGSVLLGEANPEQVMGCALVAVRSTTEDAEERPSMKEVVQELRRIRGRSLPA